MKLWRPHLIRARLDRELLTRNRPSKWDDMTALSALLVEQKGTWKEQMAEQWVNGIPMGVAGGLAGLEGQLSPPVDVAVTQTAAAIISWPITYTPLRAGAASPTIWQLYAAGAMTTAATPGTVQWQAGIGTTAGSDLLGAATAALATTASVLTGIWRVTGMVVAPRTGGGSTGNNSTAVGYFEVTWTTGTAAPGAYFAGTPLIFGGLTASSYDSSVASALHVDTLTATSVTNTLTPRLVLWGSWN
jgi:hypothetical protein